ncbi:MAG: FAD:protein FMN transferase [Pseudohongiellaceae bacterium]
MKDILRRHSFSIAFVALLFAFFFTRPGEDNGLLQLSGNTMGTTFHLQFVTLPEGVTREDVRQQVAALLQRMDRELFSTYAADSELSRFNAAAAGEPFAVSMELLEVAELAQDINALSNGAFDITIGPLVNLWGFGPGVNAGADVIPDDAAIAAARARVGSAYLKIDRQNSTLTRTRELYVDMSGIAKGYAVDKVAELFDQLGITDYFLEIGGELKIRGSKPETAGWVPAIERPVDNAPQVYQIMRTNAESLALAGSGDYRNFFERDGVRYSHEIDPRSGRPVTHNLAAAYVMDASAARADALATAFMILGYDQGRVLAENNQLPVYFIYRLPDGGFGEYFSRWFEPYLVLGN